jgi:mono/diheme cytochrome c family protein
MAIGLGVAGVVVAAGGGVLAFLSLRSPDMRPASPEAIERTPERVARGAYLVNHVADCLGCHSDHDATRFGFPIKPGTEGQGGFPFDAKFGVPGVVCAQNITPDPETGKGNWTDGEILRALREGVSRDGHALFPMMPYAAYSAMSDEDAKSVVAYLRTLKPVRHETPPRQIDFPVNLFIKFAPKPLPGAVAAPDDAKDHLGYGAYLTRLAGCGDCHTAHDEHGQLVPGRDFAGGWTMKGPWGTVVTANITPHPSTFVGRATKEQFVARFKAFASPEAAVPVSPGRNTVMPWLGFAGMTEQDLGAIYDYLKTRPAIANEVVTFPDAK